MRTERHHVITRLEIADDRSRFAAEAADLYGPPSDPGRFAFDQPYAGTLARLRQSLDYHAVRVREQNSVARLIAGNARLRLGRIELRSCGLGGSLHFVVGRC